MHYQSSALTILQIKSPLLLRTRFALKVWKNADQKLPDVIDKEENYA